MKNIENTNQEKNQKIHIVSDYLSADDITSALNEIEINSELISEGDAVRSDLHPVIMAAIVSGMVFKSVSFVKNTIIPIIRSIRKKHREKKPKGVIIIEFPNLRAEYPFDLSEDDFNTQIKKIEGLLGNPQIFITKFDEDE